MKPLIFEAPRGSLHVTWQPRDQCFTCYRPHVSVFCRTGSEVIAFAKWPASTATGAALRVWLQEIEQANTAAAAAEGLSPELLATGFGPEAHGDEADPIENTRTII